MSASNVNVVVITGNCTRDPELRYLPSGTAVCELRVAVNSRRKDASGEWVDKPNYFNVVVFGARGESCATYLAKGRPVAIEGRLDWREWQAKDTGAHREAVGIIAASVQFLGAKSEGAAEAQAPESEPEAEEPQSVPVPDVDVLAASDEELMRLTRPQLDALAAYEGVDCPEGLKAKGDVVTAIRDQTASDFGPVSGAAMSESEF
jgi:single-strand DNA-binding protein